MKMKKWILAAGLVVAGIWIVTSIGAGSQQSKVTGNANSVSPTGSEPVARVVSPDELKILKLASDEKIRGSDQAVVTVVEYGDFECPSCGAYEPVLGKLNKDFDGKIRWVFRQFPLTKIHQNAMAAAKAAEAAGRQNKFWEMHDQLYLRQQDWSNAENTDTLFETYAGIAGLDSAKFKQDLKDPSLEVRIKKDIDSGEKLNVPGTPTFYMNNKTIGLPGSYERFKKVLSDEIQLQENLVTHEHMDLLVYINGKRKDLNKPEYFEKDEDIHLHASDGTIIHKHKKGVTLETFVNSLQLTPPEPVSVWVNSQQKQNWTDYEPTDLDRIVILAGNNSGDTAAEAVKKVSDKACIYSLKCPERGKPPNENCVGGLGTPCKN